jgi:hypothetical protein
MGKKLTVKVWMVMGAAVMVLGGGASARADQEVVARVPFDFIAGGVRLPAGNYLVTQQGQRTLVSIASTDRRYFTFVLMNPMAPDRAGSAPKLVFERIGADHFLSQVVAEGKEGREVLLTPASMEREIERVTIASVR